MRQLPPSQRVPVREASASQLGVGRIVTRSEVAERLKAAVCYTETRLSTNLDFPRKSFTACHFSDQTIWLALAVETRFWRATGTIVGT